MVKSFLFSPLRFQNLHPFFQPLLHPVLKLAVNTVQKTLIAQTTEPQHPQSPWDSGEYCRWCRFPTFPGFRVQEIPRAHLLSVLSRAWFPQAAHGVSLKRVCGCFFPALCLPGVLWCVLLVLLEREEPEECWDLFWCLVRLLSTSQGCPSASWNNQCLLQAAQSWKKKQRGFSIRVFIIFWSVILHEKQSLKLLYT